MQSCGQAYVRVNDMAGPVYNLHALGMSSSFDFNSFRTRVEYY